MDIDRSYRVICVFGEPGIVRPPVSGQTLHASILDSELFTKQPCFVLEAIESRQETVPIVRAMLRA